MKRVQLMCVNQQNRMIPQKKIKHMFPIIFEFSPMSKSQKIIQQRPQASLNDIAKANMLGIFQMCNTTLTGTD